ncbi:MAG: class I SAM-dependent methyltransferase [Oscillospiraceae bacterium]|nr:class I SAM-dependent methyltransferase [Oscillospiraceae bacterium]
MWCADNWTDYKLIDSADGEKLEYWGKYLLRRPDPQAVWSVKSEKELWSRTDAWYHRSDSGGGKWQFFNKKMPERWTIGYRDLTFNIKPMGFKHTGLFPEQAVNWDWFSELIKNAGRQIRVLNLFAYTGGATAAALAAGAEVVHVDASKGMVTWAKENIISSHLGDKPVRYIVDDVKKFVRREFRRGRQYDAIIMDPPSYGRGPSGEVWKIENELYPLIEDCMKILSDIPLFFLINSYTTGLSAQVLINVLTMTVSRRFGGRVTADEIGLRMSSNGLILPCGISGRWQND